VTTNVTDTFKGVTDSLDGITDSASAASSIGKLTEFNAKIDQLKESMDKLPPEGKTKIADMIKGNLGKLESQYARLLWIPGVGDKIKNLMSGSIGKLASLAGVSPSQLPQISGDLAGNFSSLTEALGTIKDPASAEAALPKLTNISKDLDNVKTQMGSMSDVGKSTIGPLIKAAIAKLRVVVDKVLAMAGVGDKIKPVLDGIVGKLDALAT
jgi:hypothetical protein